MASPPTSILILTSLVNLWDWQINTRIAVLDKSPSMYNQIFLDEIPITDEDTKTARKAGIDSFMSEVQIDLGTIPVLAVDANNIQILAYERAIKSWRFIADRKEKATHSAVAAISVIVSRIEANTLAKLKLSKDFTDALAGHHVANLWESIPKGLIDSKSTQNQIRQALLELYNLKMQEDELLSSYTTNFRRILHSIISLGGDSPKEELLAIMFLQGLNSNYEALQGLASIGIQPTTTLQTVITAASNWKERKPPTAVAALSSASASSSSSTTPGSSFTKRRYRKPKSNNQSKRNDDGDTPKNSTIGWGAGATHTIYI